MLGWTLEERMQAWCWERLAVAREHEQRWANLYDRLWLDQGRQTTDAYDMVMLLAG